MQYNLELKTPDEFKNWLMKQPEMEGECPCCGRYAKIWKYSVHSTLAKMLIILYRLGGEREFVHVRDFTFSNTSGRNFSILKLWGLIIPMENDDPKKRTSGFWKITNKGARFVRGEIAIQALQIYDGKALSSIGELLTIKECLGKKFDYEELMGAA